MNVVKLEIVCLVKVCVCNYLIVKELAPAGCNVRQIHTNNNRT